MSGLQKNKTFLRLTVCPLRFNKKKENGLEAICSIIAKLEITKNIHLQM